MQPHHDRRTGLLSEIASQHHHDLHHDRTTIIMIGSIVMMIGGHASGVGAGVAC
jgi:hypothetical protein